VAFRPKHHYTTITSHDRYYVILRNIGKFLHKYCTIRFCSINGIISTGPQIPPSYLCNLGAKFRFEIITRIWWRIVCLGYLGDVDLDTIHRVWWTTGWRCMIAYAVPAKSGVNFKSRLVVVLSNPDANDDHVESNRDNGRDLLIRNVNRLIKSSGQRIHRIQNNILPVALRCKASESSHKRKCIQKARVNDNWKDWTKRSSRYTYARDSSVHSPNAICQQDGWQ
jgi:hypothetical protein